MVVERRILFRVKHFQQCGCWVSAKIAAEFVDLIKHKNRIVRASLAQRLNHPAWESGDVSPSMATNFSLVVNSAQTDAHKLPAKSFGDRSAQAGFTCPWRANQAENRPLEVVLELAYGEIFDHPLFDLFETEVVFVQHLASGFQIKPVLGADRPGKV